MENYQLLKSLHLLGVILFLGNIIVSATWKMLADRTKSPVIIAYVQKLVIITDFSLTATGALLLLVTGVMMSSLFGNIRDIFWLSWGGGCLLPRV